MTIDRPVIGSFRTTTGTTHTPDQDGQLDTYYAGTLLQSGVFVMADADKVFKISDGTSTVGVLMPYKHSVKSVLSTVVTGEVYVRTADAKLVLNSPVYIDSTTGYATSVGTTGTGETAKTLPQVGVCIGTGTDAYDINDINSDSPANVRYVLVLLK